jgi:transglutaminase-like putative cysteine protease
MNDITIRCGLALTYEATAPTPMILLIQPRLERGQRMECEQLTFTPNVEVEAWDDEHQNRVRRLELPVGSLTVRHDALISVPATWETQDWGDLPVPVGQLTPELLRYTLPSRYCDSDKLMDFAYQQFGHVPHGLQRVQAICDWVHHNVEYRYGSGDPRISASDTLRNRYGICRDFAHLGIALCRCFNLPARYVTGHLPDVAFQDPGSAMDFHAYFQVYAGHRWTTFDARFNVPRIGRIHLACGLDAVTCAFSTLYGGANLTGFQVWSYQVDPKVVHLGDPVDLANRLDGTMELRFAPG